MADSRRIEKWIERSEMYQRNVIDVVSSEYEAAGVSQPKRRKLKRCFHELLPIEDNQVPEEDSESTRALAPSRVATPTSHKTTATQGHTNFYRFLMTTVILDDLSFREPFISASDANRLTEDDLLLHGVNLYLNAQQLRPQQLVELPFIPRPMVTGITMMDIPFLDPLLVVLWTFDIDDVQWMLNVLPWRVVDRSVRTGRSILGIKPTTCNSLIERCMWKNTIRPCTTLFRPVLTQISFCCAFNLFATNFDADDQEPWFPSQPRRVSSCGYQTALTVLLHTDQDDYYSAIVASFGIMVLVDNAFNYPDVNSPIQLVNPSTEIFIALTPERTYSTPGVRAFNPRERPCYFKDEISLGFFREYSYHNCLLYRKAMSSHKYCGCLPYYLLDEDDGDYYRPCNFSDIDCLAENEDQFKENVPRDPDIDVMDCLPDCEHFDYPLEVSMGILAKDAPQDGLAFFKDVNLANRSLINVFFNDLVTTRYRRDVYLNWQNLLASFGGLLSLMLGFTLISAIDFVIFFSFRFAHEMFNSLSTTNSNLQVSDTDSQKKWQKINQLHVQGPRKPVTYVDVNMTEKNVTKKY